MTKVKENKIKAETTEQEIDRLKDDMDLEIDTDGMDAEDIKAFNKQKKRIIHAVESGSLVINAKGEAECTKRVYMCK